MCVIVLFCRYDNSVFSSLQIREARESRDARIRQQREALEGKLQRAEMLRESHLQEIVRKAQEEEAKVEMMLSRQYGVCSEGWLTT